MSQGAHESERVTLPSCRIFDAHHVAVHCSMLRMLQSDTHHVTLQYKYSALQCVAVCRRALQCVALHCNALQCVAAAACCSSALHSILCMHQSAHSYTLLATHADCNTHAHCNTRSLQHTLTAIHADCHTLDHAATHCTTLQHCTRILTR